MFRESNWPLEPPFLTVNVLRKLTGILELPGMMGEFVERNCGRLDKFEVQKVDELWYLMLAVPRRKITCMSRGI
jgi:hypothetical protein